MIDHLELRISEIKTKLKRTGADHRYVAVVDDRPGYSWIVAFTVATEIGDIARFCSPMKLTG